jgi:1-deoxy-D-xylulose-5-phosphate reductoisomerase
MKKVTLLGSTGSIGQNSLKVIESNSDKLELFAIAANNNIELLAKQARKFKCKYVVCNEKYKKELSRNLPPATKILTGIEGMIEISTKKETNIKAKKDIALASKEVLVMAGEIVMNEVKKNGVKMLPVDSEHNAIFQCLEGRKETDVQKIILTASGGAFRKNTIQEMNNATYKNALAHPTWNMGPKITIDCATLMNKALEIVEAHWLFNMPAEKIDVVIHPQSIIHSMVEFIDGTILAQMSITDMKLPIQYALLYPEKRRALETLSLPQIGTLTFEAPDRKKYPSLNFAYESIQKGGTMPAVMNAANEIAVEKFRTDIIKLPKIWNIIEKTIAAHKTIKHPTLEQIIEADLWARTKAVSKKIIPV